MNYKLIDEEDIQSFEYETTVISDGNITNVCELGKATIQLLNDNNKYSDYKDSWINTVHGSLFIYDISPVQENVNVMFQCYDIKYKLDTKYDKTLYTWPMTLKEWRNAIFDNCGVQYDNSDFPNSNLVINAQPYIGDSSSNRQVIALIGQAGCSIITTDENDIFYFTWFENTTHVINDWIELTTEKENSNSINCVVLGRGEVEDNVSWPRIKPVNTVEFRIDNNYILDPQSSYDQRYDVIQPIYNQINGFSYLIFNMRTQLVDNKLSIKLGQKISFLDIYDNELEAYIMSKKIKYLGGDLENDDNYEIILSAEQINETSTDLSYSGDIRNELLDVQRKTDKINGEITDVIQNVSVQNEKISKVTQTVDELNSKISDIADTTVSSDSDNAKVTLNDVNASEPVALIIHPIVENISYVYLNTNLNLSSLLYLKNRTIRFTNKSVYEETTDEVYNNYRKYYSYNDHTYTLLVRGTDYQVGDIISGTVYQNKEVDYELPDDLLYYDSNNYDEFRLTYDGSVCQIIKNCGYNADGSVYVLDRPITTYYLYPSIYLSDGDYDVEILGYLSGYIYCQLMAKNIYTTQFYTKVETDVLIDQTTNRIDLSVNRKLSNYSTIEEMNSSISLAISEVDISVDRKIGEATTGASLILKINNDVSSAKLNADKVDISANDVIDILAGNTINMTSKSIAFTSNNFTLTKFGKLTCSDANITGTVNTGNLTATGGKIGRYDITSTYLQTGTGSNQTGIGGAAAFWAGAESSTSAPFHVNYDGSLYASDAHITGGSIYLTMSSSSDAIRVEGQDSGRNFKSSLNSGVLNLYRENKVMLRLHCAASDPGGVVQLFNNSNSSTISLVGSSGRITCVSLTQTSLENQKKNFELYNSALSTIEKIDIYKYNYSYEKDDAKKHMGFVIGNNYNYSSEITSLDDDGKEMGVDLYSMTSLCLQGIKELYEKIKKIEEGEKNE